MTVENLLGRRGLVGDGPMKDRRVGYNSDRCIRYPLPKYDIFVIDMGFNLLLRFDIENLECPAG